MDNDAFLLITRLKIAAARLGMPVDALRLASDRDYASSVLGKFSGIADATGTALAAALRAKLRLAAMPAAIDPRRLTPAPAAATASQGAKQRARN